MASEGNSSPTRNVGTGNTNSELATPTLERDPFRSTEGSPLRYNSPPPSALDAPRPATNIYSSPIAERDSFEDFRRSTANQGLDRPLPLPPLPVQPSPVQPSSSRYPDDIVPRRQLTMDRDPRVDLNRRPSAIDWIVPSVEGKQVEGRPVEGRRRNTVAERLQPTIDVAIAEKEKYAVKARWTGITLNTAIGLQVILGSLTTGLSALAVSGGKSVAIPTTILGALATIVASYLARARGSNEPELSITRVKDLEQFIRECNSFKMDHGHISTDELNAQVDSRRRQFEELLGNANGERKLSSV